MPGLSNTTQAILSRLFLCWAAVGCLITAVTLITRGGFDLLAHTEIIVSLILPLLCLTLLHSKRVVGSLLGLAGLTLWLGLHLMDLFRRERLSGVGHIQNDRC